MGCNLPQLLLLIRRQIYFDVLGVTPNQVNMCSHHDVQIDNPGAATLSFAFRRPSQLSDSTRSWYHIASVRMINQINSYCLNAVRTDQLGGLGLELWQLQDRDLGRIIHYSAVYRIAV